MTLLNRTFAALVAVSTLLSGCLAQDPLPTTYKDPKTGISFDTWNVPGSSGTAGLTFGMALPSTALEDDATEFIGYLHCAAKNATTARGWCGISLGGSMVDSPLFIAYPDRGRVKTSLRFTSGYTMPGVYTGNATVTQISSAVNATGFSLTFHCQDCLHWSQNGTTGSVSTSGSMLDFGYAQSIEPPVNPSCPDGIRLARHDSQGTWTALLEDAASESYDKWRALANHTVPSNCTSTRGRNSSVPSPSRLFGSRLFG
ncbi:uncharacterized protein ASPGLDRAFT_137084 [Aspergillus glaucus CBS 516.65]|uniref:Cellobiose dehydrogenase-like cytochrome domain-containing protein n=1 Tax=Aspergillus glaucus CBS 516.65 TaxID=1160497 RepID=A0A1L9V617_ASPGL|nr:hypothetical protein ASPGLDRAFT_137084 [Aspergillus glaucus CBS 516.65]OJJ79292.1 hypothetical protein ASPGLDRAFT_137084 [Aspergillus glaucus CBS 516.65]